MKHYILKGKQVVEAGDAGEWCNFMTHHDRMVTKTEVGEVLISTVFLGYDHSSSDRCPILFESRVFNGTLNGTKRLYSTWHEAVLGHGEIVLLVKKVEAGISPDEQGRIRFLRPL